MSTVILGNDAQVTGYTRPYVEVALVTAHRLKVLTSWGIDVCAVTFPSVPAHSFSSSLLHI